MKPTVLNIQALSILVTFHGRKGCYKVRYQVFNMRGVEIVKMEYIEFHTNIIKWIGISGGGRKLLFTKIDTS